MFEKDDTECKWCHHKKSEHSKVAAWTTGAKCTVKHCPCVFFTKGEDK